MTEPWWSDDRIQLHLGDCLKVLAAMDADSIDAIVTDPPYALSFMGREWDSFSAIRTRADQRTNPAAGKSVTSTPEAYIAGQPFQAWCQRWAAECLRVLKPGGHLLAFGGTRTYHRLACGIEDAGFEVRDSMHWIYASGFPKSLDVSKAIDKAAGAERETTGQGPYASRKPRPYSGGTALHISEHDARTGHPLTAPATEDAARWNGWGTALKPAHEPIIVARKPLAGTVAANILEHGTGALNIDRCRGATTDALGGGASTKGSASHAEGWDRPWKNDPGAVAAHKARVAANVEHAQDAGRWPANVLLGPDAAAELDRQSGTSVSRIGVSRQSSAPGDGYGMTHTGAEYADRGGASRFFPVFRYEAKAASSERPRLEDGTAHPTVKPRDLIGWLVRLVTPPGGLVLDPFGGSGTTAEACLVEGFRCVLIEKDPSYAELIRTRLRKDIQPAMFGLEAS